MLKLTDIPSILVGIRFIIATQLLLDALDGHTSSWFIVGYIVAVLSDIFDGIIARKLSVSTVQLRQADSWADRSLYTCIAIAAWLVYPEIVTDFQLPLLTAIIAQVLLFFISLVKFGKLPSFHTYTAKAWGISLLIAVIGLFGFDYARTLWLAIALCWVNSLEEIAMTLLLPQWTHDVLSLFHAIKMRENLADDLPIAKKG